MKFNLFLLALVVAGCDHFENNSKDINSTTVWQSLLIVIDREDTIALNKSEDSIYFNGNGELVKELRTPDHLEKVLSGFALPISRNRRDSIYTYTNNLVENRMWPEKFCTDYVGKIKVTIQYSNTVSKTVVYSSICDWKKLNSDTKELYLLFQRIVRAK